MSLQTAMQNQDALFAMPQLQVCDVLTTCIVGIEVRHQKSEYFDTATFV
jgi:hypothetical protein